MSAPRRRRRPRANARSRLSTAGSSSERELGDAALLRGRRLARGAPAVVLEVGLGPLGELEVLVGLLGLRGELLEVVSPASPRGRSRAAAAALRRLLRSGPATRSAASGAGCSGGAPVRSPRQMPGGRRGCRAPAMSIALGGHTLTCPRQQLRRRPRPLPRHPRRSSTRRRHHRHRRRGGRRLLLGALVHRLGDLVEGAWSASVLALMSAASSEVSTSRTALIAASISSLEDASTARPAPSAGARPGRRRSRRCSGPRPARAGGGRPRRATRRR